MCDLENLTSIARAHWERDGDELSFEKLARLFCKGHDVEALERLLESTRERNFGIWFAYQSGLAIASGRSWEPSQAESCPAYDPSWMPKHLRGMDSFRKIWGDMPRPELPDIQIIQTAENDPTHVCVVSCDAMFFDLYFEDLHSSFLSTRTKRDALHIHLVNPAKNHQEVLQNLTGGYLGISVEVSQNRTPAYSACARFYAARRVMDHYSAITVIIDFDAIFTGSMSEQLRQRDEIVGRRAKSPKLPWQIWMASFTQLPNSEASRRYLDLFQNMTLAVLNDSSIEHWYIDQNALAVLMTKHAFSVENGWRLGGKVFLPSEKFKQLKMASR